MLARSVIAIGASAGGVEALRQLVSELPPDLEAAVLVILHIAPDSPSVLPQILDRAGPLPAVHAQNGLPVTPGHIYVAPPNRHMLLQDGHLRTVQGPRENRCRPAVDPLFRSAALAYGPRAIGVVLTGSLDDGTTGLRAIKQRGGIAVVQDPADALFPGMPSSALANVPVDHVVPLAELASTLIQLVATMTEERRPATVSGPSDDLKFESDLAKFDMDAIKDEDRPGKPSGFGCPDCGGVLWEIRDGEYVHYRCRVGHGYSAESLLSAQGDGVEEALWSALRALEEKASLSRRLADRARQHNQHGVVERFEEQAASASQHANILRDILLNLGQPATITASELDTG